MFVQRRSDRK